MASLGLPTPLKVHAITTLSLGLGLTFFPAAIVKSAPFVSLSRYFNVPTADITGAVSSALTQSEEQSWTNVGLLMTAIGVMYLPHWRQPSPGFVDQAVKGRILIAALALGLWFMKPKSRDLFKVAVVVEDGLNALLAGWMVGTF